MYHVSVERLQQAVLDYIRKHDLLRAGDRVGVAVSGGTDSVALLRLLLDVRNDIGLVLSAVHLNHKLRGSDSDEDERFVADLARTHGLEFHCESRDVKGYASEKHLGLEAAARECRYEFFNQLLFEKNLNKVATAHTLDDQAETVLLRLVRGTGTRGLAGIYPKLTVEGSASAKYIVRPFLGTSRRALEQYLTLLNQPWREDGSNRDLRHSRNVIRHGILPRLERHLNPAVRETLAETAQIARDEEIYWDCKLQELLPQFWQTHGGPANTAGELRCDLPAPAAVQRRIVRAASESLGLNLEFKHVEEIVALAAEHATGTANLPNGWTVRRERDVLLFSAPVEPRSSKDYERRFAVPGITEIPEADLTLEAILLNADQIAAYNPDCLLAANIATELIVRNWRPGDRFWPAHTKAPKKIKELLGEKHITGPVRETWPVLASGSEVVWVRDFRIPKQCQPKPGERAILLRETPLSRTQPSPDFHP